MWVHCGQAAARWCCCKHCCRESTDALPFLCLCPNPKKTCKTLQKNKTIPLQGFISWSIICISRTRSRTALKQEQMTSQVFTPEALILKVSARVCCHTSHHLTLWTVTKASLFPPSWYLHLSAQNHKYNHFPNVGSLFCQLFQSVTVSLHFPCMNKWKAINMSLSLHSGSLHHVPMQRTGCLLGSGFWCPICKVTKMRHRANMIHHFVDKQC